ncbi:MULTISPECIES: VOC family protein [unclassified Bacillus (in: firmicutes)]|uniref:VOC family protein n=1 Tax=unclassified Bacillus (in: firmicutes) TaxID=185979 RepID=UPI0008E66846|nr:MULTISPECIES: VOC family protein [unclassified Bacillus (in: firmicutes)]SFB02779.1 Glyoxalase-like domain-containing protein [Bacillus sp. UNCCL13]SFQ88997.1 Glyoxalase-like domain-containing protein [Bacillus sp. cl95]
MIKGLYEAHLPVKDLETSVQFYKNLELEMAYKNDKVAFFWIEKGQSWLGLWETELVSVPYHPSLRHVAFRVEIEDMLKVKEWLNDKGIEIKTDFGFTAAKQPLVLPNMPSAHAAIYFSDPDGNSLEFITPLKLDVEKDFPMMTLEEWFSK